MDYKIVMDSAGDLKEMEGAEFANVPLKILAGEREFVDNETTDVEEMVDYMSKFVGKSSTACPSTGEYLEAFGDAEDVYCVTITAACPAATMPPPSPPENIKNCTPTAGSMCSTPLLPARR